MAETDIPQQFDVLVVGAGAAGLYTALCIPNHLQVGLITKETMSLSASDWAQGGIAAAIAPGDSPSLHIEDTLKAGAGLCDHTAVEFLAQNAPSCIQSLVNLGVDFDQHHGNLALTLEAAHSRHRVLHAADTTGRKVITALTTKILQSQNIKVIRRALALDIWLSPNTQYCQGISLFYQNQIHWIQASAVILATGGGGQVFAQTTNPVVSTGDGVALAWRAGAILRDLEFIQFHPTALNKPGSDRFLISEAVRGEGAHLIDNTGRRFAFDYHKDGELAPRDVLSRAIFNHLQYISSEPTTAHVFLDMRTISPERVRYRFPNIIRVCQRWGIDIFSEPIPVAPAAHYWMGGIATDLKNQTNIPGLYIVGETASTGVHGANRLASNSLLECIVFGARMAHLKLTQLPVSYISTPMTKKLNLSEKQWQIQQDQINTIRQNLPILVWQSAGICRQQRGLYDAISTIQSWRQSFANLTLSQCLFNLKYQETINLSIPSMGSRFKLWAETRNLLDIAYLIVNSAIFRTESRGGHYRTDHPYSKDSWLVHTLIKREKWWKSPPIKD
ncbi:L-aspartate oxidase [Richelia intracellularis HH01]|uniref:L-aspartate oxidase n=1 Tax=Richelia intracellularis HH01 TaxID=1165094 RepID=M1WXP0_9NOST|nr:L-aspartate oxidase [Richelia intracellularis]CCH66432.1 L-aspartate oxidase [Richelia intracellularis HH01]HAE05649.1 L-aspartate oxidase [Richelia sp.]